MNRWSLGIVAAVGLTAGMMDAAQAQSFYVYEAPTVYVEPTYVSGVVYQPQVVVPARTVVTARSVGRRAYSDTVVVQQPIAQMAYSTSAYVPVQTVVASPVVVASPTVVRETTRATRHNFTQTVRVYGPTDGPRYSRIHVHSGLFGTRVRETVR